jgi:tight adherence protein C
MKEMEQYYTIAGAFLVISLPIYIVGWLMIVSGRRSDAIGSRRSLALGFMTEPFAYLIPVGQEPMKKLRRTMLQAGHYHRKAAEEYLGLRNAAMLAVLTLCGVWIVSISEVQRDIAPQMLISCMLVVAVYTLPAIVLGNLARSRTQRIQYSLPDAVDMINMLVTGGSPLKGAIVKASQELKPIHKDLSCELAILDHQAEAGSMEMALKQFADRINEPEVISLATIVRHADRLGGNVTSAFQDYADSIRRTRRQRAEERGNKASVKLLFPIIVFLAPSLYVLLLGPAALELRNFMVDQNQSGGILSQSPSQVEVRSEVNE